MRRSLLLCCTFLLLPSVAQGQRTPTPTAVCGDGITQRTEECDDGATVAGDGCSVTCKIEAARPTQTPTITGTPRPTRTAEPTPTSAFTDDSGGRYSLRKARMVAEVETGKLAIHRADDGRGIEFGYGTAVPVMRG